MNLILQIYENELDNPETKYFIFDTGRKEHGDVDFNYYYWEPKKYNKVKVGDLFLYRRPDSFSETRRFYFFGAGKIENIEETERSGFVRAKISKSVPFGKKLFREDLNDFIWSFKQRGVTWEHFFNMYGMNLIHKEDFLGIINLAFQSPEEILEPDEVAANLAYEVSLVQKMQKDNFFVDDQTGIQKRRVGQKVFADQVKLNYGNRCAITGIAIKEFLVGSHIIPWSERKETRLDPRNGICFSVLCDKAFDKGYITITHDYRIKLSQHLQSDPVLYNILKPYEGKKLSVPQNFLPRSDYLIWHNENVFKK